MLRIFSEKHSYLDLISEHIYLLSYFNVLTITNYLIYTLFPLRVNCAEPIKFF